MIQFTNNHGNDTSLVSDLQSSIDQMILEKEWGFSRVPHQDESWDLANEVGQKLRNNFDHLMVIGMGGSSLGAKAILNSLAPEAPVTFWNSSDPETVSRSLNNIADLHKTHWLVISKSGSTLETISLMNLALQTIKANDLNPSQQMSIVTEDRESTLSTFAKEHNLESYPHPLDVGGRFSVFTLVGMIPAAFAKIDINQLREGALWVEQNSSLIANISAGALTSFKNNLWSTVLWPYYDRFQSFCDWLVQLWSESLAKAETLDGNTAPKASYPSLCLGARDQHSILQQLAEGEKDKWIFFIKVLDHQISPLTLSPEGDIYPELIHNTTLNSICNIQADATYEALTDSGAITDRLTFEKVEAKEMGALLYLFEWVITAVGAEMNIDVFNQPGVEAGKILTKKMLID